MTNKTYLNLVKAAGTAWANHDDPTAKAIDKILDAEDKRLTKGPTMCIEHPGQETLDRVKEQRSLELRALIEEWLDATNEENDAQRAHNKTHGALTLAQDRANKLHAELYRRLPARCVIVVRGLAITASPSGTVERLKIVQ